MQADCGECAPIEWITPTKGVGIDPPANIVAIVVDIGDNMGAFNMYEKGGDRIEKLGLEEAGNRIIVPWVRSGTEFSILSV